MASNDENVVVPAEGDASAAPAAALVLGPNGEPMTKSAAKKAAKAAEKAAKAEAKGPAPKRGPAGGKEAKKKEEKPKEAEEAPFVNLTPPGEKKDLTQEMAAGYNPIAVEASWYDWWEKQGLFKPIMVKDPVTGEDIKNPKGTFVIPAPPPNVTGALHIGHALTIALQDTMIRWNRMRGLTVLFVPGYDHAGISTQSVVEKRIWKDDKLTKHDLGREKFLEKVWDWKEVYQTRISSQLKRLGASYDWDRVAFTMDPNFTAAVIETFCRMHEDGLIYRENRLVNWCCRLNTTLSNLEVDQIELEGITMMNVPGYDAKEKFEFGAITSFIYKIHDSDDQIIVATTRPETMLGDTAIAVHPDDKRYTHLHGKFAIHPFIPERKIPIITDPITVDMTFGTGAVKITPAHDHNDYECGLRHGLEIINLLNDDGTYNKNAGPYEGMKRFHIRTKILEDLKTLGLYVETKPNKMQIPVCSKSGDVIEATMKPQWWVNCKPLAEETIKRTKAGEMKIFPKFSEDEWYAWMESMKDWCISRQLWWGHRCPAYLVKFEGEKVDTSDNNSWVVGRTVEEAQERAEKKANGRKFTLEQDEDVLDTWFSSGLWPFAIMGWPKQTPDLAMFYPNTVLETGWDILFFWVARMVFFGIHLTGQMPFEEVYTHAMIRDAHGRKMSKSLGNVIDPLDVIEGCTLEALHAQLAAGNLDQKEIAKAQAGQKKDFPKGIPQCGSDAMRFTLLNYSSGNRDINMQITTVEGYRKFCNKLWNATKFAMLKLPPGFVPNASGKRTGKETVVERWILNKFNIAAEEVNKAMEVRNFMTATGSVYRFWLYELCDVYIEASKSLTDDSAPADVKLSAQNTLYTCLESGLRLLHPMMPFVTEELWQRLPRRPEEKAISISIMPYPEASKEAEDLQAEVWFDLVFSCIRASRSLSAAYNVQGGLEVYIHSTNAELKNVLEAQGPILTALTKGVKSLTVVSAAADVPEGCATEVVTTEVGVHVMVKGNVNIEMETAKLQKKIDLSRSSAEKLKNLASLPSYAQVPDEVKTRNAEQLGLFEAEIESLTRSMENFAKLA